MVNCPNKSGFHSHNSCDLPVGASNYHHTLYFVLFAHLILLYQRVPYLKHVQASFPSMAGLFEWSVPVSQKWASQSIRYRPQMHWSSVVWTLPHRCPGLLSNQDAPTFFKTGYILASGFKHCSKLQTTFQGHNQSEIRTHKGLIKKHFMNE